MSLWALFDLYGEWAAGGQKTITHAVAWVPAANVEISFMVDGLSLMWGLLVAGMGALIVLYSHWYLHEHEALGRYYGFLIAFMGSMLGVVFADHLIALFIFWELTSITSFFLIGFWSDREASNYGATKAILITGGGGLAMLGGFLLLGDMAGEWRLSQLVLTPGLAKRNIFGRLFAHHPGSRHQERAVALPHLAAERHGSAHAHQRLPALGHHGEGGHLSALALLSDSGRASRLGLRGDGLRHDDDDSGRHTLASGPMT